MRGREIICRVKGRKRARAKVEFTRLRALKCPLVGDKPFENVFRPSCKGLSGQPRRATGIYGQKWWVGNPGVARPIIEGDTWKRYTGGV